MSIESEVRISSYVFKVRSPDSSSPGTRRSFETKMVTKGCIAVSYVEDLQDKILGYVSIPSNFAPNTTLHVGKVLAGIIELAKGNVNIAEEDLHGTNFFGLNASIINPVTGYEYNPDYAELHERLPTAAPGTYPQYGCGCGHTAPYPSATASTMGALSEGAVGYYNDLDNAPVEVLGFDGLSAS